MNLSTVPARPVPAPVRLAERAWLAAIAAGAAEALVRLALPDPPTGSELGVRFADLRRAGAAGARRCAPGATACAGR